MINLRSIIPIVATHNDSRVDMLAILKSSLNYSQHLDSCNSNAVSLQFDYLLVTGNQDVSLFNFKYLIFENSHI